MRLLTHIRNFIFALVALVSFSANANNANNYIIYSISQDFPMGIEGEVLKKNFFVNIGKKQGVKDGAILDVYRTISRNDPYKDKVSYHHIVKIGELKVLHTEDDTSITVVAHNDALDNDTPQFEIRNFMIGDKVGVKID